MRIAALFLWIAVPLAVYGGYAVYGLPHIAWTYRFHDNGSPYDPWAKRRYTECTFWGPHGLITVPAEAEYCGWFKFFKAGSAQ